MRIHTGKITLAHIRTALADEQAFGRIAPHVSFKTLSEHGSRTHARAFEIQMEAAYRDRGRRTGNSGSYGPMGDGTYAATFDEWGWLLAALYKLDPDMVVGAQGSPVYDSADLFHDRTGWTYSPEALINHLQRGLEDPFPYVRKGAARKGREGSVRSSGDYAPGNRWPLRQSDLDRDYRWEPRDVGQVIVFARISAGAAA